MENQKPADDRTPSVQKPPAKAAPDQPVERVRPLFRPVDWLTLGVTTLLVFIGYYLTLAPELTLEDSGELAVGSMYAGIPHPPGYPVWTIYTYFWSLLPVGNIAWRVALGEAVSGALACGLLGFMVSRGSSMFIESIASLKEIDRRWENAICTVSGVVGGMLLGFNGFMWSQSVIVEVYSFSVLSLMGTLTMLFRWVYAPHQRRYLYLAFFIFGICFTNHQTLLLAAMGLEVAVIVVDRRIGRDLLMGNSVIYLLGLVAVYTDRLPQLANNQALMFIYHFVGIPSILGFAWLTFTTRNTKSDWIAVARDLLFVGCLGYVTMLILWATEVLPPPDTRTKGFLFMHLAGWTAIGGCAWLTFIGPRRKTVAPAAYLAAMAIGAVFMLTLLFVSADGPGAGIVKANIWRFWAYMGPGLFALAAFFWLTTRQRELASEVKIVFVLGLMWILGAGFYLYMPIAGMACPPMQWGYPRTVEGFFHALTRGQYESAHPTDILNAPLKFLDQLAIVVEGIGAEFNWVYALLAVVPFLFFFRIQKRERAWLIGLLAVYLFLAVLLVIMLNPSRDRQSLELNRVFFTASHSIVAMFIGYGITLITAAMLTHYEKFRFWGLTGGSVGVLLALIVLRDKTTEFFASSNLNVFQGIARAFNKDQYALPIFASLILLAMTVIFLMNVLLSRRRPHLTIALAVFAAMPSYSILCNWADNEQRQHWFGYWFGHDMFTPPFEGPDGKLIYDAALREQAMQGPKGNLVYPEMARDAILFGGTDPGRFCPTYMIFCDSFLPDKHKPEFDQKFDRRDVYIITQNALADGTYLQYIRSHYFRSAQKDPPFFQELLRTSKERESGYTTNFVASLAYEILDKPFTRLGATIEANRRKKGVYPPNEIYTPSNEDSQICFQEYIHDAQRRLLHDKQFPNEAKQVRPGEDISIVENRVQVRGQVAVMAINGLLTKVIFDRNPENEFYVEESFPLDWMFPHLTPHGIIMKINRDPLRELDEEVCRRDHEFWSKYSERLIGNWITYDTPVKEIVAFIEKVYLERDYSGFTGDRKFLRDDQAQKAFSKLRSSIGGVYAWRLGMSGSGATPPEYLVKNEAERQRMIREADFAFRQAFAFCPYSPEAVFRYVNLLLNTGRLDDAHAVAATCLKFDPDNTSVKDLVDRLALYRSSGELAEMQKQIAELENAVRANPGDIQKAFDLAGRYLQIQQPDRAIQVLDAIMKSPNVDLGAALGVAQVYLRLNDNPRLEATLEKVVQLAPNEPEGWYDLAVTRISLGKTVPALDALRKSMELNSRRLAQDQSARNLRTLAQSDQRLAPLRTNPEFQRIMATP